VRGLVRHLNRSGAAVGLLAATFFVALTGGNLAAQGLFYDELHQATAAFIPLGRDPETFNALALGPVPLLNMTYSGAIKSNIYALYLRTGRPFTPVSWRALGIAFVAIGLFLFCALSGRVLGPGGLATFLALFLTDTSVILLVRHDWGPVALGLALRLLLIGVWLRCALAPGPPSLRSTIGLGALVGLALFEKLHAVVLLVPLAIMLAAWGREGAGRRALAALGGLSLGATPLAFVNLLSLVRDGSLISLAHARDPNGAPKSLIGMARLALNFASLGYGRLTRRFVLGNTQAFRSSLVEGFVIIGLCAFGLILALAVLRAHRAAQRGCQVPARAPLLALALAMLLSYLATGAGLAALPRGTLAHHWIVGTPFQYAALALGVAALACLPAGDSGRWWVFSPRLVRATLLAGVAILLLLRAPIVAATERDLLAGRASAHYYDPSYSRLGEFAARSDGRALFLAAGWGVGTQIYTLSGGRDGLVREPFWSADATREIPALLTRTDRESIYLVRRRVDAPPIVFPERTEAIVRAMEGAPGWREVPPEPEVAALRAVDVRKFVRAAPSSRRDVCGSALPGGPAAGVCP
jgi:hypothetical protein